MATLLSSRLRDGELIMADLLALVQAILALALVFLLARSSADAQGGYERALWRDPAFGAWLCAAAFQFLALPALFLILGQTPAYAAAYLILVTAVQFLGALVVLRDGAPLWAAFLCSIAVTAVVRWMGRGDFLASMAATIGLYIFCGGAAFLLTIGQRSAFDRLKLRGLAFLWLAKAFAFVAALALGLGREPFGLLLNGSGCLAFTFLLGGFLLTGLEGSRQTAEAFVDAPPFDSAQGESYGFKDCR